LWVRAEGAARKNRPSRLGFNSEFASEWEAGFISS
jgi:hypothetical protein